MELLHRLPHSNITSADRNSTRTSMSPAEDVDTFFDRQLHLLQEEKNAEIAQSTLLLSNCSPKLLEQKGLALLNLVAVNIQAGMGGRNLVELGRSPAFTTSATLPPHTFRPGDIGRIDTQLSYKTSTTKKRANPGTGPLNGSFIEGVVYKVTDSRVVLAVDSQNQQGGEDINLPNLCNLLKVVNSTTYDRMQKVMLYLRTDLASEVLTENRDLILHADTMAVVNVLLGVNAPLKADKADNLEFYDTSLNESQKQSVRFAIGCKDVACIHGPPGTGKTHTLLEIIRQCLHPRHVQDSAKAPDPARKILVCGASNLSVDNILERLLLPPLPGMTVIKCTRIGHPARVKGPISSLDATLDAQSGRSEQAELIKDIKNELSESLQRIAGKAKEQKGKRPRGEEQRKLWDEIKQLRRDFRNREKGIISGVLSEAQVVLATCHSAGGRILDNMLFDVVIIDEATQALEAACWIPIIKGKKLILAGDPLQLPPTVLAQSGTKVYADHGLLRPITSDTSALQNLSLDRSESTGETTIDNQSSTDADTCPSLPEKRRSIFSHNVHAKSTQSLRPPKDLTTTLFERLEKMHGASIKKMLEVQYRMHDKICEFPSKMLYGSRLRSDKSVAMHLLRDLDNVAGKDSADLLATPIVFLDTSGCEYFERSIEDSDDGSKYNENEAMLVKSWLEKLIDAGVYPSQVAIITPYQAQVTHISSLLSATHGGELEIGTVDGMQGREKEAIIISLVRSNEKREVGFLKDKRRLNVAMTRARRHMCVIGDSSTVQHGGTFLKKWMEWLEDTADVYYGGLEELH